ncbi:hypothetical protein [Marinobacterium mangrovicola]|uniref:Uncharacterized protein n=1 Tax=Marinobacterium mangrovicola TaxID=1476959 RepID=A0A4R1G7N6_9GAMM|nr:hypothetical protein [Marinobacterium mangrovicola]TCK02711.1 hypothetical protein CLV83_4408 [Marinobacterium mangrovicola]
MKRRHFSMQSLLLMILLVLLSPWEAALAVQSCHQIVGTTPAAVVKAGQCDGETSVCDSNHSVGCCQAFCLLKARAAQSFVTPIVPVSRGWQQEALQSPLPGHARQLLHPPAS